MWLLVTSWPQRAPGTRPRIRVIDGGVFSKPPARRHYNLQGIFMKSPGTALAAHTLHGLNNAARVNKYVPLYKVYGFTFLLAELLEDVPSRGLVTGERPP